MLSVTLGGVTTALAWTAHGTSGLDDFVFAPREVPTPGRGKITVEITAAGVNPADLKHVRRAADDPSVLPLPIGYEIAGRITRASRGAVLGGGTPAVVGNRVVAFRVHGGYSQALTIPVVDAFDLPESVRDEEAAGLLLAGTTAAQLLSRSGAVAGDTIAVHGASGGVGSMLLQLARLNEIRVVGTAGAARADTVRRYGGIPVAYDAAATDGPLADRMRAAAQAPIVAALDCVGTDEAVNASLELVADRDRIVTIAARAAAREHGFEALSGTTRESVLFRNVVRHQLIRHLAKGRIEVPIAATYPLSQAREALSLVASGRAHGKVILLPD